MQPSNQWQFPDSLGASPWRTASRGRRALPARPPESVGEATSADLSVNLLVLECGQQVSSKIQTLQGSRAPAALFAWSWLWHIIGTTSACCQLSQLWGVLEVYGSVCEPHG